MFDDLSELQDKKYDAVLREDYDQAKEIKGQIDIIKDRIKAS